MTATADGLVVVDKPAGLTSHDVVARVRRLAGTRKVGHAGTLDPMATGVLVVGVNRATRLLGHLTLTEKAYDATVRLGASTVTDDAEGEVVATADATGLTAAGVAAAVAGLTGAILQVPSAVSAVKVDGQRAYKRVRAGEEVELAARPVTVQTFDVGDLRPGTEGTVDVDVHVVCSSGTYVRALARDLGAELGVGGHLTMLRRTRVGPYGLDVAHTLEALADEFVLLPIADAARAAFTARDIDAAAATVVSHGGPLPATGVPGPVAVFGPDGGFLALVEDRGDVTRAVAVFV
jgi:tRNA pseudouridine55 synthase